MMRDDSAKVFFIRLCTLYSVQYLGELETELEFFKPVSQEPRWHWLMEKNEGKKSLDAQLLEL